MLCIDVGIGMMWVGGDQAGAGRLFLTKFIIFQMKIKLLQFVNPSFFSFSEEEKRSKKEELSFLTPEISNSAEFDLGRCPKNL